jgi:hypothetical protein
MTEKFEFMNEKIVSEQLVVYNVRNTPFRIYGLYHPEEEGIFKRIPLDVAEQTSKNVRLLCTNTTGARVRFKTDSSYIAVGAVYPPMEFPSPCSTALCSAGAYSFDLYADGKFCRVLYPKDIEQNGSINNFVIADGQYEGSYDFGTKKLREITLNFPSFVDISEVYIGLKKGSVLEEGAPYKNEKPVVFYGSSITHGACASRPGNIYENIISRRLNMDYLNLGFSGSAKAEKTIIEYISTLEMSVFVFDYDHNARNPEFLRETHYPALEIFRKAQPDTPIVLLSRPNQSCGVEEVEERIRIISDSHQKLLDNGDKNVHFINGQDIYLSHDSEMMTIDDTHPTDLGFYCMAEAIEKVLRIYM